MGCLRGIVEAGIEIRQSAVLVGSVWNAFPTQAQVQSQPSVDAPIVHGTARIAVEKDVHEVLAHIARNRTARTRAGSPKKSCR